MCRCGCTQAHQHPTCTHPGACSHTSRAPLGWPTGPAPKEWCLCKGEGCLSQTVFCVCLVLYSLFRWHAPIRLQPERSSFVMPFSSPMVVGKVKPVLPDSETSQPLAFIRMTSSGSSPEKGGGSSTEFSLCRCDGATQVNPNLHAPVRRFPARLIAFRCDRSPSCEAIGPAQGEAKHN